MTDKPTTPEEWEQWRKDRNQANFDAFNALQADQQAAIKQAFKALEAAQNTLSECQDLWLSDIKELELKLLTMCEQLLPKTSMRSDKSLVDLLAKIRKELEKQT